MLHAGDQGVPPPPPDDPEDDLGESPPPLERASTADVPDHPPPLTGDPAVDGPKTPASRVRAGQSFQPGTPVSAADLGREDGKGSGTTPLAPGAALDITRAGRPHSVVFAATLPHDEVANAVLVGVSDSRSLQFLDKELKALAVRRDQQLKDFGPKNPLRPGLREIRNSETGLAEQLKALQSAQRPGTRTAPPLRGFVVDADQFELLHGMARPQVMATPPSSLPPLATPGRSVTQRLSALIERMTPRSDRQTSVGHRSPASASFGGESARRTLDFSGESASWTATRISSVGDDPPSSPRIRPLAGSTVRGPGIGRDTLLPARNFDPTSTAGAMSPGQSLVIAGRARAVFVASLKSAFLTEQDHQILVRAQDAKARQALAQLPQQLDGFSMEDGARVDGKKAVSRWTGNAREVPLPHRPLVKGSSGNDLFVIDLRWVPTKVG
jgi:hypothetical protein